MKVLLTGASGQLGSYVGDLLFDKGCDFAAWTAGTTDKRWGVELQPVDLADPAKMKNALSFFRPDAILHLGAISAAEAVRRDPERGRLVNVEGTRILADWSKEHGTRLVFTSTDLVFDGEAPWRSEDDPAEPILAYGRTKRAAEETLRDLPRGLVARVSLLYGPSRCGRAAYYDQTVAGLRAGRPQTLFEDEFRTPLDLLSAARLLVGLLEVEANGVVHVAGRERMSRFEFVQRVARALGLDESLVLANRRADVSLAEPRPADVSLRTDRLAALLPGIERPAVEDALREMDLDSKPLG